MAKVSKNVGSMSILLERGKQELVTLEDLYYIEFTPFGPVPAITVTKQEAINDHDLFREARKQAYTFEEVKGHLVEYFARVSASIHNMEKEKFDKLLTDCKDNPEKLNSFKKMIEDIEENAPRIDKTEMDRKDLKNEIEDQEEAEEIDSTDDEKEEEDTEDEKATEDDKSQDDDIPNSIANDRIEQLEGDAENKDEN